jgi:hypothetical protein
MMCPMPDLATNVLYYGDNLDISDNLDIMRG